MVSEDDLLGWPLDYLLPCRSSPNGSQFFLQRAGANGDAQGEQRLMCCVYNPCMQSVQHVVGHFPAWLCPLQRMGPMPMPHTPGEA